MWRKKKSMADDYELQLPRFWFGLFHLLGAVAVFVMGMKFGKRRSFTIPGMAFQVLRMLAARR